MKKWWVAQKGALTLKAVEERLAQWIPPDIAQAWLAVMNVVGRDRPDFHFAAIVASMCMVLACYNDSENVRKHASVATHVWPARAWLRVFLR